MSNPLAVIGHASGAETVSGVSSVIDLGARNALRVTLEASVFTGTNPKITVKVESSPSGTAGWKTIGTMPALSVETFCEETLGSVLRFVRFSWTVEGTTPSVMFSLTAEAHVTYASVRDIERIGIVKATLATVKTGDKVEALIGATDTADRYLCREFTLPLTAWGNDLRRLVTHIAVYDIMCVRGFQLEGADAIIVKRYDDAIAALREVGDGDACMPDIVDTDPGGSSSGDGDYDVAELEPGIYFEAYPFGESLDDSAF